MSVNLTPSGRWKAQCRWNGASYYVGLYHSRELAIEAVSQEYENLRAGTSVHLIGTATLTSKDYAARIQAKLGTIKRWIHEGLPVERRGPVVRIDPDKADAWVKQHHPKSIAIGRESLVYIAQRDSDDAVKIGWADDVERRLRELRKIEYCQVCLVAAVPGDKVLEQALHRRFAPKRLDGEWFAVSPSEAFSALREAA